MSQLSLKEKKNEKLSTFSVWVIVNSKTKELITARLKKLPAKRVVDELQKESKEKFEIVEVHLRFKKLRLQQILDKIK